MQYAVYHVVVFVSVHTERNSDIVNILFQGQADQY